MLVVYPECCMPDEGERMRLRVDVMDHFQPEKKDCPQDHAVATRVCISRSCSACLLVLLALISLLFLPFSVQAQAPEASAGAALTSATAAPAAPTVMMQKPMITGPDEVRLEGLVNPNSSTTTVSFEYGLTTSYGSTVTAAQSPVAGDTLQEVSASITGLDPAATYHCRMTATNSGGTTNGADYTFCIGNAPTATTTGATSPGPDGATLNGIVNANGDRTSVYFEYGLTTSYGSTATPSQPIVTGDSDTPVSAELTGLTEGTTYHYRVAANNSSGTRLGADMTFITSTMEAPTAATDGASAVLSTSAVLNGTVNANNGNTTVTFEYGLDTNYGTTVTAEESPVTGVTPTSVSAPVTDLLPSTTYHFRCKGVNDEGSSYGADMTFTTAAAPPQATTLPATNLSQQRATLNGTVNAGGGSTTVNFEYGPDTNYGTTVPASQSPVTGSTETPVSVELGDLQMDTTYHYRVAATNDEDSSFGADMTFATRGPGTPVVTTASEVTNITAHSAVSGGTVVSDGGAHVTARGVCWATAPKPNLNDDPCSTDGEGLGSFTSQITGLEPDTLYRVRAFATNSEGTNYGEDITLWTPSPNPDPIPSINLLLSDGPDDGPF